MVSATGDVQRLVRPAPPPERRPVDQILINDLRVLVVIGALPHEQEQPQPVRVDLALHVDLTEAGRSDDLDETVDYGLVADQVAELAADQKFVLLERFADEITHLALRFDRVEAVDVTATKIRPPVATAVDSTAVRLHRGRADVDVPRLHSHEAVLALGSNLGDREGYLRFALDSLDRVVDASQVFETAPVGGPEDQGAYLNMVVKVETSLDPFALLRRCQRIENHAEASTTRSSESSAKRR